MALLSIVITVILLSLLNTLRAQNFLYDEFINIYVEVAYLSDKGLNVTHLTEQLKELYKAILVNDTEKAHLLISSLWKNLEETKREASKELVLRKIEKGAIVTFFACLPLLVYLLLPRIYLYVWYKTKKRWVIKTEPT